MPSASIFTRKLVKTKKDLLIAVGGAFVILILLDLTPLSGNTIAWAHYVNCGGAPYQSTIVSLQQLPYYAKTQMSPTLFRGYPAYFCTPEQAERAGYSADPKKYEFPHLPISEWESAIEASSNLSK